MAKPITTTTKKYNSVKFKRKEKKENHTKNKGNKTKKKEVGFHQARKFLPSKENNQQNEKAVHGMG